MKAYNLLEDKQSKDVFLRSLKLLYTGESCCLKESDYPQYFHPNVQIEKGDNFIDGGLGSSFDEFGLTLYFANLIGENGTLFAFEPEEHNWKVVEEYFSKHNTNNIKLNNYGLWKCKDTLEISNNTSGSSMFYAQERGTTVCKLISIDEYTRENAIERIDFIKMDIEGAELEALKGAEKIIKKCRPKMAISVYHLPEHIFSIILYLNSLNLGYKFYLGHHRPTMHETVLYAIAK